MNKNKCFILLTILIINSLTYCKAQNNNTQDMEIYNFELMNNSKYNSIGIVRNGWKIVMTKMSESGAFYYEYPPAPKFYTILKNFYPSGKIQSKIMYTGEKLTFGESIYYDEEGKIIRRVNEDAKFGKIKIDDLLRFIEKEGWINLDTGEGREDIEILEDGRCYKIQSDFSISERKNADDISYWLITIPATPNHNFIKTTYHLDKNSGEVLYKHSEKINYKR